MMLRLLLALLPALGVHTAAPPLLPGADTPPRGLNTWDSFRYWASDLGAKSIDRGFRGLT
jgi:hypothetical protein